MPRELENGYPTHRGIVNAKRICKQWFVARTNSHQSTATVITALGVVASVKQLQ